MFQLYIVPILPFLARLTKETLGVPHAFSTAKARKKVRGCLNNLLHNFAIPCPAYYTALACIERLYGLERNRMAKAEQVEYNLLDTELFTGTPLNEYELWCLRELVHRGYDDHRVAKGTIWSPPNPFIGRNINQEIRKIIDDAVETDLIAKTGTYPLGTEDLEEHKLRQAPEDWQKKFIEQQKKQLETTLALTDKGLAEYMASGDLLHFRITPQGAAKLVGFRRLVFEEFTQQFWDDISAVET